MKARTSEEIFIKYWDKYIEESPRGDYMNFEAELAYNMEAYKNLPIPAEELNKISRYEAQKIVDKRTAELKNTMKLIQDIEAGKASLGYTTYNQDHLAMRELVDRFEFNCFQLSVFKKEHLA